MDRTRKLLIINKPYLEEHDNTVRLCAKIEYDGTSKVMFFEVDCKWKNYLCTENIDAFVSGLLYFAICNGYDIRSEATINYRLHYQIVNYVIPVLHSIDNEEYHDIQLNTGIDHLKFDNEKAVGTAVSGGVDSFYSVVKHTCDVQDEYRLTHLLVANLFNIYESENQTRDKFSKLTMQSKAIGDEMGLEVISVYTNHHEFMYNHFVSLYSYRLCSYVFALQKLFGVYYISSGVAIKDTNFYNVDSDDYDIFNLSMASTDNVIFYSSGGECLRTEKLNFISNNPVVRKHLHVCTYSDEGNCSTCNKCLRTMMSLDILGKLVDYENFFDIKKYKKNKRYVVRKMFAEKWHLYDDLIDSAKKYGYKFNNIDKIIGKFIYKPGIYIKSLLKKSKKIKRLYFKLKIDYMLYGKEKAECFRYGRDDIE